MMTAEQKTREATQRQDRQIQFAHMRNGAIGGLTFLYKIRNLSFVSLLTGHITWAFCLIIRNTLIVQCNELKFSSESVAMPL